MTMVGRHGLTRIARAGLAGLLLMLGLAVRAGEARADLTGSAIHFVPSDAAMFDSTLQLRRQLDLLLGSQAWSRFQGGVMYQGIVMGIRTAWNDSSNPILQEVKRQLESPDNQALLQLCRQAVQDEIFVYAPSEQVTTISQWLDIARQVNEMQVEILEDAENEDDKAIREKLAERLKQLPQNLQLPAMTIGFRLQDTSVAGPQLERLAEQIRSHLKSHENDKVKQLAERVVRKSFGPADVISMTFKGTDLPWEDWTADDGTTEVEHELIAAVRRTLEPMELEIGIGTAGNFGLIAVGPQLEYLSRLGTSPSLYEHEKLAPLRDFADRDLVSITYASQELMNAAGNTQYQLKSNFDVLHATLLQAAAEQEIPEELLSELESDFEKVTATIIGWMPKPGAMLDFVFLNTDAGQPGMEGYTYDWSENKLVDGSAPLPLLDYLGPDPLMFATSHMNLDESCYEGLVTCLQRLDYYLGKMAEAESTEDLDGYRQAREQFLPLLQRADQVVRQKLLPTLELGQIALVIDGYSSHRKWHRDLPESDEPLVMPHIAWLQGVKDTAATEEGLKELFRVAQDFYVKLRETAGEDAEDWPWTVLPEPTVEYVSSGKLFSYPLPAEAGLNSSVRPHGALGNKVLVLGYLPQSTQQLLDPQRELPLLNEGEFSGPLAGASYLNFAAMMQIVQSWTDYGYSAWLASSEVDPNQAFGFQMVKNQVDILLDVFGCFRTFVATAYQQDGAIVTHYRWEIRDLEE